MASKQFCVLPYLSFESDFSFSIFAVWKATPENWKKHFGEDNTTFLEMYVDKDLGPIKTISVITCQSHLAYHDWETLISVLFFLVSGTNLGNPNLYSENFYFELWECLDNPKGGYTRIDKFSRRIISSHFKEKILPSQFLNWNNKITLDSNSREFKFFVSEIDRGFNSSLFRSLIFFIKTQFKDSYSFPEEADVQNFCSAFQCFLGVSVRADVAKVIANELAKRLNLPDEIKIQIKGWMEKLYEIRSIYTHGQEVTAEKLNYQGQRHIDIAKRVFQILIMKRCHGNGEKIYDEFLIRYFLSNEVFRSVVKTLSQDQAKEKLLNCEEKNLLGFIKHLRNMYANFDQKLVDYEPKSRIKKALKTLLYIFEDLYFKIAVINGSEHFLYPLHKTKELLDRHTADKIRDYESVIKELDAHGLSADCRDPDEKVKEITFRNLIPLSELLNAFANLRDVYLGYHRL